MVWHRGWWCGHGFCISCDICFCPSIKARPHHKCWHSRWIWGMICVYRFWYNYLSSLLLSANKINCQRKRQPCWDRKIRDWLTDFFFLSRWLIEIFVPMLPLCWANINYSLDYFIFDTLTYFQAKGASIGDVYISSEVAFHDRRIPIPVMFIFHPWIMSSEFCCC